MRVRCVLLLCALCLGAAHSVGAEVAFTLGSYDYNSGSGIWEYNYSIDNRAGTDYIYNLFLGNIDDATITASPSGWDTIFGDTSIHGFASWEATNQTAWLAPGADPLSGFIVTSPFGPAHTATWELATDTDGNPATTGDTNLLTGEADGPSQPEPASLCLLALALGPALAWRRRLKLRASPASTTSKA